MPATEYGSAHASRPWGTPTHSLCINPLTLNPMQAFLDPQETLQ